MESLNTRSIATIRTKQGVECVTQSLDTLAQLMLQGFQLVSQLKPAVEMKCRSKENSAIMEASKGASTALSSSGTSAMATPECDLAVRE